MRDNRLTATAWGYLGLLWLIALGQRLPMLAVPPLLPIIHHSLHMDETAIGALNGLPTILMAAGAIPGSLLIARIGARRALVASVLGVSIAGGLRGVGDSGVVLFAMTFALGICVAMSQPAIPSLVKEWLPNRIGFATAIYSNGFLIGEIIPVAITLPFVLPAVGGSWGLAFFVWSIPIFLTAIGVLFATSHTHREPGAPPVRWWPDWSSPLTWRLGLILGSASIGYWGTNAFVPDYLKATHHGALITVTLTVLNVSQLPASFLIAAMPDRTIGRRWPVIMAGTLMVIGATGIGLGGAWTIAMGALIGYATATIFVVALALPAMIAPDDVHRLSAAMFTISYTCGFIGSLAGGAIWDATSIPLTAFLPQVVAGVAMCLIVLGLRIPEHHERPHAELYVS